MIEEKYKFSLSDLDGKLLPLLRNKVFHVTMEVSYRGILESGYIDPKFGRKYGKNWEGDSYGSKRSLVCLFDLRKITDQEIDDFLCRCDFLYDQKFGDFTAYLIISESCFQALIPNEVAVSETHYSEFFVPLLEAWYPGRLSVGNVQKVLLVHKERCHNIRFSDQE